MYITHRYSAAKYGFVLITRHSGGMTSAALYRLFADKEAMFSALVEPALSEVEAQVAAVMEAARQRGIHVNEVREEELHLLISAYITSIFEVVVHDFSEEKARHYLKTLEDFFNPGWRKILGF